MISSYAAPIFRVNMVILTSSAGVKLCINKIHVPIADPPTELSELSQLTLAMFNKFSCHAHF